MENKQIIKDLTISVNRIKKARYAKHKQHQHYLQEVDTITILNTEFTKEQLKNIHQAYNIINQAKLKIANAKPTKAQQREQQLNKAYGTDKPHISELSTLELEYIKLKQQNKANGENRSLPKQTTNTPYPIETNKERRNQTMKSTIQEYYRPYDLYDVLDQEDIDNFNNNQIYTGINLITINPITKPNLGIQFQDKWYNTITELENILEPDTTYNLQYITDYDSDTQQTENYYIVKEVK